MFNHQIFHRFHFRFHQKESSLLSSGTRSVFVGADTNFLIVDTLNFDIMFQAINYVSTRTHIHSHTLTHAHTHIALTHTHSHTHTHTHHTHTHTHAHTQTYTHHTHIILRHTHHTPHTTHHTHTLHTHAHTQTHTPHTTHHTHHTEKFLKFIAIDEKLKIEWLNDFRSSCLCLQQKGLWWGVSVEILRIRLFKSIAGVAHRQECASAPVR
jgi:uncharacterized protein involved in copper resistance